MDRTFYGNNHINYIRIFNVKNFFYNWPFIFAYNKLQLSFKCIQEEIPFQIRYFLFLIKRHFKVSSSSLTTDTTKLISTLQKYCLWSFWEDYYVYVFKNVGMGMIQKNVSISCETYHKNVLHILFQCTIIFIHEK